jgi:hypothetical protein
MADLLDRTARQVRPGTGQGPIHRLVSNRLDRRQGRLYGTRCDKVLSGVSGAMLTTHDATCLACLSPGLALRGQGPAEASA